MQQYLPPAAQEKYREIKDLQREAEDVVARRSDAEDRLADVEDALDSLDDVDDGESVYRGVGAVRVETTAGAAADALEGERDRLEERIERLDEEETRLREQFENRKADIKHLLGGPTGGPNTGAGN